MSRRRLFALLMVICVTICMAALMTACKSGGKPEETAKDTASAEEETASDQDEAATAEEKSGSAEEKDTEQQADDSVSPKTMYVNSEDGLLLRKGPGTDNEVIHLLSYGQEIQVEKTENGWAYTIVDSHAGWCSMEYLTENKEDIKAEEKKSSSDFDPDKLVEPDNNAEYGYHGYVDSPEGLNMRYGPGEKYGIIDVIPDKTELTEIGWDEGWVYIEYKGKKGWISSQYFMMEGGKEKPVIYLYPEKTMDVSVRISLSDGVFTRSIPEGDGEWNVVARPDSRLTDKASGRSYDYIFWESSDNTEYDWSEGYVVKGCESEEFLLRILPEMGLNSKEYGEFIDYWLPRLEKNEYNLITFQTDRYTDSARLDVNPQPDSILRVFMAFKAVDGPLNVNSPAIEPFERKGFTVVEWGGAEVR
ncbi:MAG: SH3 domain-containing protein [Clostridia bacterium]|nr:SH3 domain-containing protein [Clostridia bacterium]